jgi:hypothetical protein
MFVCIDNTYKSAAAKTKLLYKKTKQFLTLFQTLPPKLSLITLFSKRTVSYISYTQYYFNSFLLSECRVTDSLTELTSHHNRPKRQQCPRVATRSAVLLNSPAHLQLTNSGNESLAVSTNSPTEIHSPGPPWSLNPSLNR